MGRIIQLERAGLYWVQLYSNATRKFICFFILSLGSTLPSPKCCSPPLGRLRRRSSVAYLPDTELRDRNRDGTVPCADAKESCAESGAASRVHYCCYPIIRKNLIWLILERRLSELLLYGVLIVWAAFLGN